MGEDPTPASISVTYVIVFPYRGNGSNLRYYVWPDREKLFLKDTHGTAGLISGLKFLALWLLRHAYTASIKYYLIRCVTKGYLCKVGAILLCVAFSEPLRRRVAIKANPALAMCCSRNALLQWGEGGGGPNFLSAFSRSWF